MPQMNDILSLLGWRTWPWYVKLRWYWWQLTDPISRTLYRIWYRIGIHYDWFAESDLDLILDEYYGTPDDTNLPPCD